MKRRVTVITREVFERVTFAPPRARVWCERCEGETEWVTPEEAARLSVASVRVVCRAVETGLTHFVETPDGMLLVCAASLPGRPAV